MEIWSTAGKRFLIRTPTLYGNKEIMKITSEDFLDTREGLISEGALENSGQPRGCMINYNQRRN